MDNTGKNKILLLIIAVLVVTNLGMLWYFSKPEKEEKPRSRNERMAEYMKKELGFDDAQVKQYLAYRELRDSVMAPLNMEMRAARMEMVNLLRQPSVPDSLVKAVVTRIGEKQVPIELESYNHFRRTQSLCRPDQQAKYDSMLVRMVKRNTGDGSQR
jgi:periplasmic protein CpxP/Spy